MLKTPGKMHMYDMVKIDTIVFEIVGGGLLKPPPPQIVSCLPGSDIEITKICKDYACTHKLLFN